MKRDESEAGARASEVARHMWLRDEASRWLGMTLESVAPGSASLAMTVAPHMVNSENICHGGLVFTLADSAFAYACNAHNQRCVGAASAIEYLLPAQLGDRLLARAAEVSRRGRTGLYDVRVTNQREELVALFRGRSATIKGVWIE